MEGRLKDKKKKNYCVRLWYTWYDDIEVEAESAEEAVDIVKEKPWEEIVEDFNTNDLEFDASEVFGGEEE